MPAADVLGGVPHDRLPLAFAGSALERLVALVPGPRGRTGARRPAHQDLPRPKLMPERADMGHTARVEGAPSQVGSGAAPPATIFSRLVNRQVVPVLRIIQDCAYVQWRLACGGFRSAGSLESLESLE